MLLKGKYVVRVNVWMIRDSRCEKDGDIEKSEN